MKQFNKYLRQNNSIKTAYNLIKWIVNLVIK